MCNIITFILLLSALSSHAQAISCNILLKNTSDKVEDNSVDIIVGNEWLFEYTSDEKKRLQKALKWIDTKITDEDKWKFTPEEEERFESIFEDTETTPSKKFELLYQELTQARLKSLNPASKFFAKRALDDALVQKSIYSKTLGRILQKIYGPHYNLVLNRISMKVYDRNNIQPVEALIAFHEVEHLVHRNTKPTTQALLALVFLKEVFMILRTPFTPTLRRHIESKAIGAQWEIASRVPKETRKALINEIKNAPNKLRDQDETLINLILDSTAIEYTYFLFNTYTGATLLSDYDQFLILKILLGKLTKSEKEEIRNKKSESSNLQSHQIDWFFTVLENGLNETHLDLIPQNIEPSYALRRHLNDGEKSLEELLKKSLYNKSKSQIELENIFLSSLQYADYDKPQFIELLSIDHGYQFKSIMESHYKPNIWKLFLLLASSEGLYQIATQGTEAEDPLLIANDLRWLWQLFSYLVSG